MLLIEGKIGSLVMNKNRDVPRSIEKETVCSSGSDGGFQLHTFDDVIKYNTGKSLLCFLKIGGNHEVQLLAAAATRCSIPVVYN